MIIYNLDTVGIPIVPFKTDPPLVIDANAVLACAIPFQLFQLVRGWNAQVVECHRPVQHSQLAKGALLNRGRKLSRTLAVEDFFGFVTPEGSYHGRALSRELLVEVPRQAFGSHTAVFIPMASLSFPRAFYVEGQGGSSASVLIRQRPLRIAGLHEEHHQHDGRLRRPDVPYQRIAVKRVGVKDGCHDVPPVYV